MRVGCLVGAAAVAVVLVRPAAVGAESFDQTAPIAPNSVPLDPAQRAQDKAALGGDDPLAPLPPPAPTPPLPHFEDRTPAPR